jgi:ABC-2 type transport system ATP-binding protein
MTSSLAPQGTLLETIAAPLAVEILNVSKRFGGRVVVDALSCAVERGQTFGVVGPNGSGKTTTIRMLLNIIRPDSGRIAVLGAPISDAVKDRIGYLPEERGLYRGVSVRRTLLYLAALKGVPEREATPRIEALLRRTELWQHRNKKVGELSRGMSQLIGFCAAVQHDPELLILDEPFSGLDPLNVKLMKEMIAEIGRAGTTIIFSTHQMEDVEELCERVLMLDHGHRVLYGRLAEIKARYRENTIQIEFEGELGRPHGVDRVLRRGASAADLVLAPSADPQDVLRQLIAAGLRLTHFELAAPSLTDIFIRIAEARGGA